MAYRRRGSSSRSSRNSGSKHVNNYGSRSKSSSGRRFPGIKINRSGYKQFKDGNTGKLTYIHRRVAEKMIGGKIYPGREVHHIDGNKTNNRPSNLVVVSKAEHRFIHSKRYRNCRS